MTVKSIFSKLSLIFMVGVFFIPFSWSAHAQADLQQAAPEIQAEAAFAFDYDTGAIFIDQNADELRPIASMTKMITAYEVLQAIEEGKLKWDDPVTASPHAAQISQLPGLSNVPLIEGKKYSVRELMEAQAIYSANAASIALAEHLAGTEADFVHMMRQQVESWGITDYQIINASGLNNALIPEKYWYAESTVEDENYMSARDMAKVAYHLLTDYPVYLDLASISEKVFRPGDEEETPMVNYNWLLEGLPFERPGVSGIKTGTTEAAGACLAFSAHEDDRRLIGLVMGAGDGIENKSQRFEASNQVLDYGFNGLEKKDVHLSDILASNQLPIRYGQQDYIQLYSDEHYVLSVMAENPQFNYEIEWDPTYRNEQGDFLAPIQKWQVIGRLTLTPGFDSFYQSAEEEQSFSYDIKAAESVGELDKVDRWMQDAQRFFEALSQQIQAWGQSLGQRLGLE